MFMKAKYYIKLTRDIMYTLAKSLCFASAVEKKIRSWRLFINVEFDLNLEKSVILRKYSINKIKITSCAEMFKLIKIYLKKGVSQHDMDRT